MTYAVYYYLFVWGYKLLLWGSDIYKTPVSNRCDRFLEILWTYIYLVKEVMRLFPVTQTIVF